MQHILEYTFFCTELLVYKDQQPLWPSLQASTTTESSPPFGMTARPVRVRPPSMKNSRLSPFFIISSIYCNQQNKKERMKWSKYIREFFCKALHVSLFFLNGYCTKTCYVLLSVNNVGYSRLKLREKQKQPAQGVQTLTVLRMAL